MGAPIPSHSLVHGDKIDPVWFRYLQSLDGKANASDIRAIATALGSPDGTVANIPEQSADDVRILQGAGIAVTRDDAGAYAIALRPLGDSGAGTFKLITRDSTGRISGSADGSAADVPYDNTASGLAATDAQAAIDELADEKLDDAPSDGSLYGRKDGAWAIVPGSGTGAWTTIAKSADETRSSTSTTPTDDAILVLALDASSRYIIKLRAYVEATGGGFKYTTAYSGTTSKIMTHRRASVAIGGATGTDNELTSTFDSLLSGSNLGSTSGMGSVELDIILQTTTLGTFAFQWSKNSAVAGDVTVLGGSYLEYMKL